MVKRPARASAPALRWLKQSPSTRGSSAMSSLLLQVVLTPLLALLTVWLVCDEDQPPAARYCPSRPPLRFRRRARFPASARGPVFR